MHSVKFLKSEHQTQSQLQSKKNVTLWFYNAEMRSKDADGMAYSVHTDQTALL